MNIWLIAEVYLSLVYAIPCIVCVIEEIQDSYILILICQYAEYVSCTFKRPLLKTRFAHIKNVENTVPRIEGLSCITDVQ
jgi:hypothetical protein